MKAVRLTPTPDPTIISIHTELPREDCLTLAIIVPSWRLIQGHFLMCPLASPSIPTPYWFHQPAY